MGWCLGGLGRNVARANRSAGGALDRKQSPSGAGDFSIHAHASQSGSASCAGKPGAGRASYARLATVSPLAYSCDAAAGRVFQILWVLDMSVITPREVVWIYMIGVLMCGLVLALALASRLLPAE